MATRLLSRLTMRTAGLTLLLTACTAELVVTPRHGDEPEAPTARALTLVEVTRPAVATVLTGVVDAKALALVSGRVAVVLHDRVALRDGSSMAPVPVGERGDDALGTIRAVGRRDAASLWLTSAGVFLERDGRLLRSPASDGLPLDSVRWVDVVKGADEVWWLETEGAVLQLSSAGARSLVIEDPKAKGPVRAVVGRDASRAVVVQADRVYAVDLEGPSVSVLARGVTQAITHRARLGDGHVVFGTPEGLVRVSPSNEVELLSLGDGGVADVVVDGDGALVQVSGRLVSVLVDDVRVLGEVAAPVSAGVVRDATGAIFALDGEALRRFATTPEEQPVRFPDVREFFKAHCTSCHASGANDAKVIDFTSYAKAKEWADEAMERVQSADEPMPPPSSGPSLRKSQYEVLRRWIADGSLP